MRLRLNGVGGAPRFGRRLAWLAVLAWSIAWIAVPAATGRAADTPAAAAAVAPAAEMSSAGWLEHIAMKLEKEAMSDVSMLPDTPAALAREWRSFDRDGSTLGALVSLGWVVLAAAIALLAEKAASRGLSRNLRRAMRARPGGPTLIGLLLLLLCDVVGVAVFVAVFSYSRRHWLMRLGVTMTLGLFATEVLIRWRLASLVVGAMLRPREPVARLIDVSDDEARRLARFLSGVILAIVALIGFGRFGLADEDSGAPHVIGLMVAAIVCALRRADRVSRARRRRGADPWPSQRRHHRRVSRRARARLAADRPDAGRRAGGVLCVRTVARPVVLLSRRRLDLGGAVRPALPRKADRAGLARFRSGDRQARRRGRPAGGAHHPPYSACGRSVDCGDDARVDLDRRDRTARGRSGPGDAVGRGGGRHAAGRLYRLGAGPAGDRPASAGCRRRPEAAGRRRRGRDRAGLAAADHAADAARRRSGWSSPCWRR